jgi:hypothetical protein
MPEEQQTIGSGFTEGELQFASFWVRNQVIIRKVTYVVVIALNALFWGYAIWGFIDAYAISYPRESRITQEIAENAFIAQQLQSNKPRSIQTRSVTVFEGTDGRYDMVIPIENPNEEWYAEFTYRFNFSGEQTPLRSGYALPKVPTYLGEYGYTPETTGGRSAALTVDSIHWMRVQPEVVGASYADWLEDRSSFVIDDITYRKDVKVGNKNVGRTSFVFKNPTAYGYWSIGLHILLYRGDSPVAATYLTLREVKPGEERQVDVDWFENLPSITETQITTDINYFDDSNYLPTSRF